jgi:asparagine synthase (glutamine-hydrolysing)
MTYTDPKLALPDDMLTKVDKMTMLNSLEARTPFLDYRLVEYAFNIPSKYKLQGTNGKLILKDAFKDLLPDVILGKPKSGFGVLVGEWFRKELKETLYDALSAKKLDEQGIFNYNYISKLIDDHINEKNDYTPQIWSLFVFELWFEM